VTVPNKATPATALCGKPAPNVDRFAGEIDTNMTLVDLQAQRLSRIFALSLATAATIARLTFSWSR
jgi:hypothetical protein